MGGAGSARPSRSQRLDRAISPSGHGPAAWSPRVMGRMGIRMASQCGRTECAPPRRPPFAPSGGFSARRPALRLASPRRGGLRTPGTMASRGGRGPSFWLSARRTLPVSTTCFGSSVGRISGRAERIPPRKRPSAPSRAFPR